MKLTDKRFWKFETIIVLCSFFPVIVMALIFPMSRDNDFENLMGYFIVYITSLTINSLGGIVAWKLSKETTPCLLFALYQWITHVAVVALVLIVIIIAHLMLFADTSLPPVPYEMSNYDMSIIIILGETYIFAFPILISSYFANKLSKSKSMKCTETKE